MKIGIMQPYFFPYIGYFSLIKETDFWVVFDDVQFIRHGWIERNRVLGSSDEWQYIKVPLIKAPRETKIMDTKIRMEENWEQKILSQLVCYRKRAPFYSQVIEIVEKMFQTKYEKIVDLNIIALETVCNYLQIPFNYTVYSKSQKSINELVHSPGEWALYIAKSYQAEIYINPYGGEEIFNRDQYQKEGIEIKFLKNDLTPYNQRRGRFEPGLSIIDVMMFNSPEECLNLINQYQLT